NYTENIIDRMSYNEIIEKIQKLSPGYRTVFNLFVIDGFKHEEIAKKLNISVGTSKSNLAKARASIQKLFQEERMQHE
ncbi:sigma-70 region 4 domain-containing protein, partial [Acinetobacter baumannii]